MTATAVLARARAGDEEAFRELTDPHRRALQLHCYRILGSMQDAEDLVQETLLAAWRSLEAFEGRASMRAWLYRIATNRCLNALRARSRRPQEVQAMDEAPAPTRRTEPIWLEPYPDVLLEALPDRSPGPAARYEAREAIELAFIVALQHLPARQRAVLILRDVLRWKAAEVAEALETTTASVNSALQRAHATLEKAQLTEDTVAEPSPEQKEMLDRYVQAFWEKDIEAIVAMLTRDAIWEMPPFTGWYQGNENIGRLIDTQCPGGVHDMRMLSTRANGQPAYGLYMRCEDGTFTPFHLQVLTLGPDGVRHVGAFFDASLFARFGLPASLPADYDPTSVPA
jgi:RNA polymerase sigma-70 factor (ECF subfamily)